MGSHHLWRIGVIGLAAVGLAACSAPQKAAEPSSRPNAPAVSTIGVTLTGIVLRIAGQAVFFYGSDMAKITTPQQLQAYFASGVTISESPYPTASDKIKVAAYVLQPPPQLPAAFVPHTTVQIRVPSAQEAISRQMQVDLTSVDGIPTTKVQTVRFAQ